MARIWKSIVADSKKTIDEYFDLIVDNLLLQCGSRLWRSREASCLAIADLIQGQRFSQVIGSHYLIPVIPFVKTLNVCNI
jgi:proteasome component ECM29